MINNKKSWTITDYSQAMKNAIESLADHRLLKISGDKILFNGFWRNGDKQNVCFWPKTATWHDAKTGDGGGCKEFAKIAFGLSLNSFMVKFSDKTYTETIDVAKAFSKNPSNIDIDEIFLKLQEKDRRREDKAKEWLLNNRGFLNPRGNIFSGFANLDKSDIELFDKKHQSFIKYRLDIGPQIVAPLRGVNSNKVQNLYFRTIKDCAKGEKCALLANTGGWHDPDGTPRAFGSPHYIYEFSELFLCEGMADYFAVECLLMDRKRDSISIGAGHASQLIKWAQYLVSINYKGKVILVNQLDKNNNKIESQAIGQKYSVEAKKILINNNIKTTFFPWHRFLNDIEQSFFVDIERISDIADVCSFFNTNNLSPIFEGALL